LYRSYGTRVKPPRRPSPLLPRSTSAARPLSSGGPGKAPPSLTLLPPVAAYAFNGGGVKTGFPDARPCAPLR